jgi:hypothetical protein
VGGRKQLLHRDRGTDLISSRDSGSLLLKDGSRQAKELKDSTFCFSV